MITAARVALLSVVVTGAITGTIAVTEGADTSTASGTVTAPSFTGSSAVTEGADTSTASGTYTPPSFTGTIAVTEGADTSTASGDVTNPPGSITGTIAVTEGADTSTASGTFTPAAITGTIAVTEGADTSTSSTALDFTGPLTITVSIPSGRRVLTTEGRIMADISGRGGEAISYTTVLYAAGSLAWTSSLPTLVTWRATHSDGSTALTGSATAAVNGVVTLDVDLTAETYTTAKQWVLTIDVDGETFPTNPSRSHLTLETLPNR